MSRELLVGRKWDPEGEMGGVTVLNKGSLTVLNKLPRVLWFSGH